MKKILLSGLCTFMISTGAVKPCVTSFFTFPVKKIASTTKHGTLATFSAIRMVGNAVLGTCQTAKEIMMELPTTISSLCLTGIEGVQLALWATAVLSVVYGTDAALKYATNIGLPKSIFGTYEFGTMCKKVNSLLAEYIPKSAKNVIYEYAIKLYKSINLETVKETI